MKIAIEVSVPNWLTKEQLETVIQFLNNSHRAYETLENNKKVFNINTINQKPLGIEYEE